jgi:hypothetical protein
MLSTNEIYVPIEFLAPCETLLFEPQLGELKNYSQSLQVFLIFTPSSLKSKYVVHHYLVKKNIKHEF